MGAKVGRGSLVDGRTFWVRPVGSWVLESNNVVAEAMAISLDKPMGRTAIGPANHTTTVTSTDPR